MYVTLSGDGGIEKSHPCKLGLWPLFRCWVLCWMCGRACHCIHLAHLHEWDFSIPPPPTVGNTVCSAVLPNGRATLNYFSVCLFSVLTMGTIIKLWGRGRGVLSGWCKWLLQLHVPSILSNNDNYKRILSGKVGDGFGLL